MPWTQILPDTCLNCLFKVLVINVSSFHFHKQQNLLVAILRPPAPNTQAIFYLCECLNDIIDFCASKANTYRILGRA